MISPDCSNAYCRFDCRLVRFCEWGARVNDKYRLIIPDMRTSDSVAGIIKDHQVDEFPCVKIVRMRLSKKKRNRKNRYKKIRKIYENPNGLQAGHKRT